MASVFADELRCACGHPTRVATEKDTLLPCGCVYATATDEAFEAAGVVFDLRKLGPQKDKDGYWIKYTRTRPLWGLPEAPWDTNDEDAYNMETDQFDARKIVTQCPACGRDQSALCSPYTRLIESGWRWVGMEYKEPYSTFVARCRCKTMFVFTTHTPQ